MIKFKYSFLLLFLILSFSCSERKERAFYKRAKKLEANLKFSDAINEYKKAMALNPKGTYGKKSALAIANIYYDLNKHTYAIKYYDLLLAFDLEDIEKVFIYRRLAWIYENIYNDVQRTKEANIILLNTIGYGVKTVDIVFKLVEIYNSENNFDISIELLIKLLSVDQVEKKDRIYYELANCYYLKSHNKSEKFKDLERLDEDYIKQARSYLNVIIKENTSQSYVILAKFLSAQLYEELEDFKNALDLYKSIEYLYPRQNVIKAKIEKMKNRIRRKTPQLNKSYYQAR
jgi:tetratricopeptide (TPR) repeat protein